MGAKFGSGELRFTQMAPIISRRINLIVSHGESGFGSGVGKLKVQDSLITVEQTDTIAFIVLNSREIDALKIGARLGNSKIVNLGINPLTGETRWAYPQSPDASTLANWEMGRTLMEERMKPLVGTWTGDIEGH